MSVDGPPEKANRKFAVDLLSTTVVRSFPRLLKKVPTLLAYSFAY